VLIAEDEALIRLDLAEMLREEDTTSSQRPPMARRRSSSLVTCARVWSSWTSRCEGGRHLGGRHDRRRAIAPVVMLTAFSQRELIEQARDAGAMAYLVKPFARHELVRPSSCRSAGSRDAGAGD